MRTIHHPNKRREAGFTLVEVLVALTITVIGLMGLMSIHTTTLQGNRNASRAAEATTVCQRSLEELRTMTIDGGVGSIVDKYGALPIAAAPMDTVSGRAGMVYTRTLEAEELTAVSADLIRLRVTVQWSDSGDDPSTTPPESNHAMTLELIRTRQELL